MASLPALDRDARAALRASVERFGVIVPVVFNRGSLLDGENRLAIAEELGVDCPRLELDLNDEDAERVSVELNTARRQLSREQRVEIVKALREEGHSQRAIAGALGVSDMTIRRDLEGATPVAPERTIGRDGKSYPARKATVPKKLRVPDDGELTQRQKEHAGAQKRRLEEIIGACAGAAEAAQMLKVEMILQTARPEDYERWLAGLKGAISGLRKLQTQLREGQ